ncbi:MAG: ABC transporter substrate-binding protein [Christensenellales bacterium]
MKRYLSLLLVLMLFASVVPAMAATANPYEVDESLTGEFTWWSFFDQTPFLKEQFQLKYPNVKVNLEVFGGDEYQTKLMNTLPSGQGVPDVFDLEEGYVYKFIDSPLLADLEQLGLSGADSNYYDWAIAMGRDANGVLKGICDNVSPVAFWYLRDAMAKWLGTSDDAEISALLNSWDAIKAKALEIKEASGGTVFLWPNLGEMVKVSAFSLTPFVRNGEFAVREGWLDLLNTMRDFNDAGIVANLGSWSGEWATAWNDGTLLIRTMPSWDFFTNWDKNTGNVGVAAPFQNSYEGGTYRAIYANSPNKEVCIKFLEFLTTQEYQLANLAANNQMPANKLIAGVLGEGYTNERFGGQNIIKTYDLISQNIPDIIPDQYTRGVQNKFSKHAQQGVKDGLSNEVIMENFIKEVKDTYPELKGL